MIVVRPEDGCGKSFIYLFIFRSSSKCFCGFGEGPHLTDELLAP